MRAIWIAILLLGGCATTVDGNQLTGVEWHAVDINGAPIPPGAAVTLTLGDGNSATGSAACNNFSGGYRLLSARRIAFDAFSVTERACEPALMAAESTYLSILRNAQGYSFYRDGNLSVIAADGRAIRFFRAR